MTPRTESPRNSSRSFDCFDVPRAMCRNDRWVSDVFRSSVSLNVMPRCRWNSSIALASSAIPVRVPTGFEVKKLLIEAISPLKNPPPWRAAASGRREPLLAVAGRSPRLPPR